MCLNLSLKDVETVKLASLADFDCAVLFYVSADYLQGPKTDNTIMA